LGHLQLVEGADQVGGEDLRPSALTGGHDVEDAQRLV
jgi:hypothetical protein